MTLESHGELVDQNLIARVREVERLEEIEDLLDKAMIIAGLFYVPPEDVERMSEINERLGELGL